MFLMERLSVYLRGWDKWTGVAKPQYRERRYLIAEQGPRKKAERLVGRAVWRRGRHLPTVEKDLEELARAEGEKVGNIVDEAN